MFSPSEIYEERQVKRQNVLCVEQRFLLYFELQPLLTFLIAINLEVEDFEIDMFVN